MLEVVRIIEEFQSYLQNEVTVKQANFLDLVARFTNGRSIEKVVMQKSYDTLILRNMLRTVDQKIKKCSINDYESTQQLTLFKDNLSEWLNFLETDYYARLKKCLLAIKNAHFLRNTKLYLEINYIKKEKFQDSRESDNKTNVNMNTERQNIKIKSDTLTKNENQNRSIISDDLNQKQIPTVIHKKSIPKEIDFSKKENQRIPIHIFYGRDICLEKGHNLEPVKALVPDIRTKKQITLNVFYCKTCNKYRINNHGAEGFEMLMSKNIYPMVLLEQIYQPGKELKKHSLLNLYGYTVQKGVYTDAARQNILSSILDGNLLKKPYILDRLRYNIDYIGKGPNMGRAVIKWEDDYKFVSNYRINQQKKINGRIVTAR